MSILQTFEDCLEGKPGWTRLFVRGPTHLTKKVPRVREENLPLRDSNPFKPDWFCLNYFPNPPSLIGVFMIFNLDLQQNALAMIFMIICAKATQRSRRLGRNAAEM